MTLDRDTIPEEWKSSNAEPWTCADPKCGCDGTGLLEIGDQVILQKVPFDIGRFAGESFIASFSFALAMIVLAAAGKVAWIVLHL